MRKEAEATIVDTATEKDAKLLKRKVISDIVTQQSNTPSTQANNATATRAKAKPTTRLGRLPRGQLPSVLPHLSSGRSAGQQPTRGLPCYELALGNPTQTNS